MVDVNRIDRAEAGKKKDEAKTAKSPTASVTPKDTKASPEPTTDPKVAALLEEEIAIRHQLATMANPISIFAQKTKAELTQRLTSCWHQGTLLKPIEDRVEHR